MTRITVTVGDTVLAATLEDSAPARDFASMLPLDLVLEDYHGTEKIAGLGRQLDNRGEPRAYAPKAGDITQYRPWSNLAIFYRDFPSSPGLLKLGRFDGPLDALLGAGNTPVRIELAD
ncbi:cyclophilin-like fold protein [Mangrovicoccus sp. HB161399]|uniref:cyclophilin-like fold protein n=1 Tax=Mangrovicoccus sp. HB161399 TaxID=2720392 RepID=UPI001552B14F|nr:cyclophilin-like fold protein [Mangrovicoccus sp. HB161399]